MPHKNAFTPQTQDRNPSLGLPSSIPPRAGLGDVAGEGTFQQLMGVPTQSTVDRQNSNRNIALRREFIKKLFELQAQGQKPQEALLGALQTPVGQEFLATDAEAFSSAQSLIGLLQTPQDPLLTSSQVIQTMGPDGRKLETISGAVAGGSTPAAPQATVGASLSTTDYLRLVAVGAQPDEGARPEGVPAGITPDQASEALVANTRPSGGTQPSVTDYLKIRAAGAQPGTTPPGIPTGGLSQEEAQTALTIGQQPSGATINDLLLRANGQTVGKGNVDAISPEAAKAALDLRAELFGADNFLSAMLETLSNQGQPASAKSGAPTVSDNARPEGGPQISGAVTQEQIQGLTVDDVSKMDEATAKRVGSAMDITKMDKAVAEAILDKAGFGAPAAQ